MRKPTYDESAIAIDEWPTDKIWVGVMVARTMLLGVRLILTTKEIREAGEVHHGGWGREERDDPDNHF